MFQEFQNLKIFKYGVYEFKVFIVRLYFVSSLSCFFIETMTSLANVKSRLRKVINHFFMSELNRRNHWYRLEHRTNGSQQSKLIEWIEGNTIRRSQKKR